METVSAACRVLLRYLINTLQSATNESSLNSAQIECILNAIRVLCIGTGLLPPTEISALVNIMKGENLPSNSNTSIPGKCTTTKAKY